MNINRRLILFTIILIALQVCCKLLFANNPDLSGLSPFVAIALFSGFIVKEKNMSFLLPLLALFISDAVIHILYLNNLFGFAGFYGGQWKNYLLLLAVTAIGWILKGRNYSTLTAGAIAAPTLYFLVSNFMVWQATSEAVYARSFNGLMACYDAGIPFYRNSLIATVVFLPLIIVAYNYLTRNKAELKLA
ncbi:MAG: hypothetical protein HZB42_13015 [Sphingobacteriales bacterium]|nr:hypothetical protein [Sphingobacteriales bacterium]